MKRETKYVPLFEQFVQMNEKKSYMELEFRMDKYLPDEFDLQEIFYRLLDKKEKEKLIEFFDIWAEDEIMQRYMPKDGTIEGFVDYLIQKEEKNKKENETGN